VVSPGAVCCGFQADPAPMLLLMLLRLLLLFDD